MTVIDAFAGVGGLSLGFKGAGFSVPLAFDNDPVAVETHRKNLADNVQVVDASNVSGHELLERASLRKGEVDVLVGGPPCQGFSLQRRGARDDDRNKLVLRYLEWLEHIRPRAFVVENVPAIRSVRGREVIQAVENRALELGYRLYARVLNAADYGVGQVRLRALLVGVSQDYLFQWPEPTTEIPVTVRQAIGDLPTPPEDGRPHADIANHYREARLSPTNRERIRWIPEGGGREHLPSHLQLKCHSNGHRHLDTYGRLAWDRPSVTITARFDSFTRGRFGHPVEDRTITLREGARLQGFPDDFVFLGNREQGARHIGNAVPPPLGFAVATSIRSALEG